MRTIKALIDGAWHGALEETPDIRRTLANAGGGFRHRVSADRASTFLAEPNRYHLYVSYACPWAHRTIIYRKLKGLEDAISMSILHPRWAGPGGWRFADGPMSTSDHVGGRRFLYEAYQAAKPDYTGRVTVPVLWDRQNETIVNNQSGDIIRMLNSAFDAWGNDSVDFYPAGLRADIDAMNKWLLPNICAAVYRVGFASSQAGYNVAIRSLFESLDQVEKRVTTQPYLLGEQITECDWHLFATLCRFDSVYFGALKCNLRRIIDYPALCAYTHRLHSIPGVADTVRVDQMKHHYYDAIGEIDATIVPQGPAVDYTNRDCTDSSTGVEAFTESGLDPTADLFVEEVLDLHQYLEHWLKGKIANRNGVPTRLEHVLADSFSVSHPSGKRGNKADVVQNFAAAYGEKPAEYALEIRGISVHMLDGDLCLATYTESHRGEPHRTRMSTALLRRRADRRTIEWLFLIETPVHGSGPDIATANQPQSIARSQELERNPST